MWQFIGVTLSTGLPTYHLYAPLYQGRVLVERRPRTSLGAGGNLFPSPPDASSA